MRRTKEITEAIRHTEALIEALRCGRTARIDEDKLDDVIRYLRSLEHRLAAYETMLIDDGK